MYVGLSTSIDISIMKMKYKKNQPLLAVKQLITKPTKWP